MDYEKKYKNLLERAIKRRDENCDGCKICLESLFDELRESEDEMIRKNCIHFLELQKSHHASTVEIDECIAWLEKQNHDGKKWIYEDVYLKEKEQLIQDGIDEVLENPQKYGLEKQVGCELDCPQNHQDSSHPNGCIVLEDFNGGEGFYKVHLDYLNKKQVEEVEEMIRAWNKELKTPNETIKACIGMALTDVPETRFKSYGTNLKDCLAWLEKQCGQKPFDYENTNIKQNNFAPKFKLGDWIVWKDKCYKVNDNGCGYELIDTNGLSTSLEYGTVDENARLWTIADAKDGDILSAYECIVVFKEIDWLNIRCYCAYHYLNHQAFYVDTLQNKTAFHPATKEQRDLLFQKMEEDGYEFDFNKKELKKTPEESLGISSEKYNEIVNECIFGEEKKSKWSEEDDYNVQCCIAKAECDIENGCIGRNKELIEWLKSLKHRLQ